MAYVALITGTRGGLGRYLAEHLLARGVCVVGCSRQPSDLAGSGYEHVLADVTSDRDVKRLFLTIRQKYGKLDWLINNAGLFAMAPVLLTAEDTVRSILATNICGTFLCMREAIGLMKKGGSGRIVNLTSVAVPGAFAGSSVYGASKAAVEQFTRVVAKEAGPYGITVNALGFPPVENTGMAEAMPEKARTEVLQQTVLKRPVTLTEAAHAVDFFLAPESQAVTGQILYLGGP
jgi:3-oxoacyl-[acyl-carrier protein] reductase